MIDFHDKLSLNIIIKKIKEKGEKGYSCIECYSYIYYDRQITQDFFSSLITL